MREVISALPERLNRNQPTHAASRSTEQLVSVVMIFLNAERFIEEAIESVLAQTYPQWELLLVDDGSTDRSTEIARRYAEQYPSQVFYLEHDGHENHGMSASRNLGIQHCHGEYVACLDADDVWLPNTLVDQVGILAAHPEAAMVYGPAERWHSWTGLLEDAGRDAVEETGVQANTLVNAPALLTLFLRDEGAKPSGPLVRRAVVERVGGFEEAFRGRYEDQAFCAKVCLDHPVYVAGQCWYRYRRHPDSCCSLERAGASDAEYRAARLLFLRWLAGYLNKQRVQDREVRGALRNEIWKIRYPGIYPRLVKAYQVGKRIEQGVTDLARLVVPAPLRARIRARLKGYEYSPPVGWVGFGSLRRVTPISRAWGFDRGQPIDRYYVEKFLHAHRSDVRGRVLEIADNAYTHRFGEGRVTRSDVLHVSERGPKTTIVADLTRADQIPPDTFDCIIFTQTLPFIDDPRAALATIHRILKPGGVVLATFPGITRISRSDMSKWGHFWSFTTLSARRLFEEAFSGGPVSCQAHGNVLAASAFLYGLAASELRRQELDHVDPDYEVVIAVRAVKPRDARR